ncbi:MAG: hypothetical protein KJ052_10360 [Candidatus Hydrogenedentes bacterium]|nr:hypothetical protein [Candidatus Hydrogenedentota bacterium]
MDMMVGAVPSHGRDVYPAFQLERGLEFINIARDQQFLKLRDVLGTAGIDDVELARRQVYVLTVGAIDLRLKIEVGVFIDSRDTARRKRIHANQAAAHGLYRAGGHARRLLQPVILRDNPFHLVHEDERGHGRLAIVVAYAEFDANRRGRLEQDGHFITKTEVLRTLAHIKTEPRFAGAGIGAVELNYCILEG